MLGSRTFGALQKTGTFRGAADNVALVTNDLEISHDFWLTTGLQLINTRRYSDIVFPVYNHSSRVSYYLAPRIGLLYNLTPDVQAFANGTRSVEPENSWAFSGGPTPTQLFSRNLREQTAWTGEAGARVKVGIFQGSVSYYRSAIRNELVSVEVSPNVRVESNATPTTHQGVELGVTSTLWQDDARATDDLRHRLYLQQSYTWNDFHYVRDPVFGSNRLPGIPEHFYQAALHYEHPSGFYASFDAQPASSYPVDYSNTFYTRSYVIFGARIGYSQPKEGFEAYLDFRNLTNKHYAVSVSPFYDDRGRDNARSNPGDGFGVFSGVSYRL